MYHLGKVSVQPIYCNTMQSPTLLSTIPVKCGFSLPEIISSGWETVKGEDTSVIPQDVHVDSSQLPLTTNEDGEQVLRMYWLDAYEDYFRQPG